MDAYLSECDWYCEECADDSMIGYTDGGGESDCPQNCANCQRPLGNPLTSEGVEYVLEYIREQLAWSQEKLQAVYDMPRPDYYHGSPACAVVRDWAEQLTWYSLDADDAFLVQAYLDWCNGVRTVKLPDMIVRFGNGVGTIESELDCDVLESFILAAACAGVDIEAPAFVKALETTIEAIDNND